MGALTTKSVKPKIIYAANGQKLKEVWCRGTKIWGSAVKITFVEGSARTTVEYEEGATVDRATAPTGASFVGWSTSPSGTNAMRTFKATQNMTVYRVIRWNNQNFSGGARVDEDSSWREWGRINVNLAIASEPYLYVAAACKAGSGYFQLQEYSDSSIPAKLITVGADKAAQAMKIASQQVWIFRNRTDAHNNGDYVSWSGYVPGKQAIG